MQVTHLLLQADNRCAMDPQHIFYLFNLKQRTTEQQQVEFTIVSKTTQNHLPSCRKCWMIQDLLMHSEKQKMSQIHQQQRKIARKVMSELILAGRRVQFGGAGSREWAPIKGIEFISFLWSWCIFSSQQIQSLLISNWHFV